MLKPLQDAPQSEFDQISDKSAVPFRGGETSAKKRVEFYFEQGPEGQDPPVKTYKTTRNGMLGHAYSTKLSPFFSLGCVSPRYVYEALQRYHKKHGETKDSYWVQFEMLFVLSNGTKSLADLSAQVGVIISYSVDASLAQSSSVCVSSNEY